MGAEEILRVLREGDKLTSMEIAERSKCSVASIQQSMKRLLKDVTEDIKIRRLTNEEKKIKYGRTVGCKVYLYWINE